LNANPERLIPAIDRLSLFCGRVAACAVLLMALLTVIVVVLRYALNSGSVALQELTTYLHAVIFMLGAAWTLRRQGHVRVDIIYRRLSARNRAWVDSVGTIVFLLPMCVFIGWISWDYVLASWSVRESSPDPGGLPAVFLLKGLILVLAGSLLLQACAELLRSLHSLMDLPP
jgi:TRAP-type mannitol/chloroaromatic compound transport system permease small subunit